jgi:hypothetical protein
MDRGADEERRRVKTDFSLAIGEMWYGGGRRDSDPVFAELKKAGEEFKADLEKDFHFDWNIVDVDESHIYVTNKTNGHRYHISVICPAALYVDVYCVNEDGTECRVF